MGKIFLFELNVLSLLEGLRIEINAYCTLMYTLISILMFSKSEN